MTVVEHDDRALLDAVRRRLLRAPFDARALDRPQLRAHLEAVLRDEAPLCTAPAAARVLDVLTDEVAGLGPLERWLSDPEVSEVMVNGPGRAYVERAGRIEAVPLDLDAAGIARVAERIVAPLGLRLDRSAPMVDARLPDGSRVHAVLPPLAPDGPCITIRRFVARDVGIEAFDAGRAAPFLPAMVAAGWNIVVVGATSAGKTTLCNTLARSIDPGERIVTIEETAELRLPQPHVVRLESRPANAEGIGAVSVRDLVRAALRMRPDRLVVGEVRGAEVVDLLAALNTGHEGGCGTVHANSPRDVPARLEALGVAAGLDRSAVHSQVAAGLRAVVHVTRDGATRRVSEIGLVSRVGEAVHVVPALVTKGSDASRGPASPELETLLGGAPG